MAKICFLEDALCQNTQLVLASSKEEISTALDNYIKLQFNSMLQSRGNKDSVEAQKFQLGFYHYSRAPFIAIVVLIIDLEEQTRFVKAQSEHQSWMMRNPTLSYFQLNSQSDHTNHSHHGL